MSSYSAFSPPGSAPSPVTALPSSPFDGQEVTYKAGTGDAAVLWRLRYDATITDAYKWRFLGGAPLTHSVATDQSTTSGAYVDLATVGPTITVPLAGIYEAHLRASMYTNGAGTARCVLSVGGVVQADDTGLEMSAGAVADSRAGYYPSLTLAASGVVKMVYSQAGGGAKDFRHRHLRVTPIRVG